MKKILFSCIVITILISCNKTQTKKSSIIIEKTEKDSIEKNVEVDLKKIAGKSRIEVDKILGKAETVETFKESSTPCRNKPCEKAYYQKDKFEIIFIDGKADWITVNNLSQYNFDQDKIEIFGLPITEPEFNNPQDVIRWKNIENINEISIFNNGSNKISYAYIKVSTE
ncbi:hypothetical protein IRZ71_03890 [Flavobacterium sp. ANB]|uniref:hypothetical protein n=1 Tax=unclassified Flavobacterium TaxID=196869 RepID=UPI0012B72A27|nr:MULTISPECIES: hypothetical protein [unclassified Flavobacterium]MBF4515465.1 hypothetical protein [Flavobacterium sp. ANB]MTD68468.1 hypothetical protein [Flavobacterium sp. LC2016-13]